MARKSTSADGKPKPKRVRRKCKAPGCVNRVVQGGVCVTHGAKRKLCSHPGCSKAVKLAGFCSAHGPARRKCDWVGPPDESGEPRTCDRVAVQGGRCLSHGARRRVCNYPGGECGKNAISGGMCKKHYDRVRDAEGMIEMSMCLPAAGGGVAAGGLVTVGSGGVGEGGGVNYSGGGASEGANYNGVSVSSSDGTSILAGGTGAGHGGSLAGPAGSELGEGGGGGEAESVFSSPSWGSAAGTANSVGSVEHGHHHEAGVATLSASASAPDLGAMAHKRGRSHGRKTHQGHLRGLSIFDEMPTVDAIINSGSGEAQGDGQGEGEQSRVRVEPPSQGEQGHAQPQIHHEPPQQVRQEPPQRIQTRHVAYPPPRYPQAAPQAAETPIPRASFADGNVNGILRKSSSLSVTGESPCTGNASCTCKACRSPTLAIFEQMIVASQKLESGELEGYTGLSPPKLGSPRKASAGGMDTPRSASGKQVSFLPEEPTSTGSVVRKVSSNNIVGEDCPWGETAPPQERQDYFRQGVRRDPQESWRERHAAGGGRASHALAAMPTDDGGVSRTVSHDVDDGTRQYPSHGHHGQHLALGHQDRSQAHQAPRHLGGHHDTSHRRHEQGRHDARRSSGHRHHQRRRQGATAPVPPEFHPPQTPALYDQSSSAPVASSERHAYRCEHLLPKPRDTVAHLFIPKEA